MRNVIKCPNCGYEYLPGEIYLPDRFIGKPKDVERNSNGEIVCDYGAPMDLEESFECENCGCAFKVHADLTFSVGKDVLRNFDEDYVVSVYPNRITLEE